MDTPNYGYEKRQKEPAKKRKKEEKLKNRAECHFNDESASESEAASSITNPANESTASDPN